MKTLFMVLAVVVGVIVALVLRSGRRTQVKGPFPYSGARTVDTWQDAISIKSERDWQPPQRNRDPALDRLMTEEQLQKPRDRRN